MRHAQAGLTVIVVRPRLRGSDRWSDIVGWTSDIRNHDGHAVFLSEVIIV